MTAVPDLGLNASQPNLQTACAFSVERVRVVGPALTGDCAAAFQPTTADSNRGRRPLGFAPLPVLIALVACVARSADAYSISASSPSASSATTSSVGTCKV